MNYTNATGKGASTGADLEEVMVLVTKFLARHRREEALRGLVKIGSHDDYNKSQEPGGLMSDVEEGMGSLSVWGPVIGFNGRFGGSNYRNCNFVNFNTKAPTMRLDLSSNRLLYCSTHGSYDAATHSSIVHGAGEYQGSEDRTSFLVYDVERLRRALTMATDEYFHLSTTWVYGRVRYSERHQRMPAGQFRGVSDDEERQRLFELAFTKPKKFSVEQEGRFAMAMVPGAKAPRMVLTAQLSEKVRTAFVDAIHDVGFDDALSAPA